MFFVFILFYIYLIFRIFKWWYSRPWDSGYKSECYGNCNPIYKNYEWIHQCDKSKFYREPLTTCTGCLKILDREGCKDCKQGHCRKCGQRFRWNMPFYDSDFPMWIHCKKCKEWHCMNCAMKEIRANLADIC